MPANSSLRNAYIVAESTYGTTPATPTFDFYKENTPGLQKSQDTFVSGTHTGDRQIKDVQMGRTNVAGNIDSEMSHNDFDSIIEAALGGTWSSNAVSTGTTRRSFSIMDYIRDLSAGAYQIYTGCEVNTLSFAMPIDQAVTISTGWLGSDMEDPADSAPSGSTLNAQSANIAMQMINGSMSIDGSQTSIITEANFEINNQLKPRFSGGYKNTQKYAVLGRSNITGSITAYFEDVTELNKFLTDTALDLQFVLSDGTNTMTIDLDQVKYTGGEKGAGDVDGDIPLTLPFQAYYDPSSTTNITFTRSA